MLMTTTDEAAILYGMGCRVGLYPNVLDRLSEDARDNLEAYISNSAESSLDTFRFDIIRWVAWAETNDADPLNPRARQVRDYVKEYGPGLKPSSLKRMVSAVGNLTHKIAGNPNHTKSMLVSAELKRHRREKGTSHRQALAIRQKGDVMNIDSPSLPFSIERMIAVLEPDKSLWGARAKFLLSLGGDTGRRGGEYRLARMGHLVPAHDELGGGLFHIPRSKTDQAGVGIIKYASKRTVRYFEAYREALREREGDISPDAPLIVPVDRWEVVRTSRGKVGKPLTTKGLIMILRQIVRRALTLMIAQGESIPDLDQIVRGISGHSFRVGLAMDLVTAGESIAAICVEGGWETPAMPVYYSRMITARTGASARLANRLAY